MEHRYYKLGYAGNGLDLFKVKLVNTILIIVTLGFYYPWAKARTTSFLYSQTNFEGSPFSFTGTGKEMFKGFIKVVLFFLAFYGLLIYAASTKSFALIQLFLLLYLLAIIVLVPIVMHGAYKYRLAKSNWRGIRFGYVGERKALVKIYLKGIILTFFTLGFYSSFFAINMRRYLLSNIRFGDAKFYYDADGSDYFWLNVKGAFLTFFTFGIYFFWWQRDQLNFFVNNLRLEHEEKPIFFHSEVKPVDIFELIVINLLIIFFSVGLGTPWAITRTLEFYTRNIRLNGYIEVDELEQTQDVYSDAMGEEFSDVLDLGVV